MLANFTSIKLDPTFFFRSVYYNFCKIDLVSISFCISIKFEQIELIKLL